jgi:mRNA interferase RelE/StbE
MKVSVRKTFEADVRHIHEKKLLSSIERIITHIEGADNLHLIANLKKLKGYKHYYRIRIGDYRIGLSIEQNEVAFVRFMHRKDIYKNFPPQ